MGDRPALLLAGRMDATRVLLFGGTLLIVLGMLLGEIYAIFISHVASAEIRQRLFTVVEAVAAQDLATVDRQFDVIESLLERRGRIVNTHSHSIAFGFLALSLTILQPILGWAEHRKRQLAWLIVLGAFLQSVFVFASPYIGLWGNWISNLGAVMVIAGVVGTTLGLRHRKAQPLPLTAHVAPLLRSPSSSILVKAGGILIVAGMVFGLYYAWVFVTQHEVQQWQFLDSALTHSLADNRDAAIAAVADYRRVQSKIAILPAAHSHAIELGVLAILLAFIQNFVLLSERWKVRWAWVFAIGSLMLPIFVYHATVVGLVSAGFADLSGLAALVALVAMLVGIIRYTGAKDLERHGGHT